MAATRATHGIARRVKHGVRFGWTWQRREYGVDDRFPSVPQISTMDATFNEYFVPPAMDFCAHFGNAR